jgi:hypothetical protein
LGIAKDRPAIGFADFPRRQHGAREAEKVALAANRSDASLRAGKRQLDRRFVAIGLAAAVGPSFMSRSFDRALSRSAAKLALTLPWIQEMIMRVLTYTRTHCS